MSTENPNTPTAPAAEIRISGLTGSGKSNALAKVLAELRVMSPDTVIEITVTKAASSR
ncbi:hypothetical protein Ppa06_64680 [Planomonospora parontospora subsp. parontospora]|uniref:Uncharacterized protein n=2 Tax=Planomonospora parontospora TaxID=58119 RepID=A0AA37F7L8_9ACTN|nr:hypothetical protein [Planomonospora parontospora]GGK94301.1 hypothetical protein GCM10010126_62140 [Planomonospora parontospora]GII12670.1 hypothetical protein Ppa06_64680 [Planomonospora parontospora subsp. parontospora]